MRTKTKYENVNNYKQTETFQIINQFYRKNKKNRKIHTSMKESNV